MKISVIICTYNNQDKIDATLKSVNQQSCKDYEIVVIDDGSTDSTVKKAKAYEKVQVIVKKENSGPSISRNIGIKRTKGKYLVFLDSDVELEEEWLKNMYKFMERNQSVGIAGGKLVYKTNPNKLNAAGGSMYYCGIGFDIGDGAKANSKKYNKQRECLYVCSAAMIVRRSMLQKIGVFDETYFYGNEDTDLGWRANIAGYKVVYTPSVTAKHNLRATMSKRKPLLYYYATRNRIRGVIKNYEGKNAITQLVILLVLTIGDIVVRKHRIVKIKAILWNLLSIKKTLSQRKKIQKTRKKSDKELKNMLRSNRRLFKKKT